MPRRRRPPRLTRWERLVANYLRNPKKWITVLSILGAIPLAWGGAIFVSAKLKPYLFMNANVTYLMMRDAEGLLKTYQADLAKNPGSVAAQEKVAYYGKVVKDYEAQVKASGQ